MLELNSFVELKREWGSVSFYTDGIWPGIEIENGHVLAIRNAVFSAFQLDGGGGVFAVLNKKPELEAADIAYTSMAWSV